MATDYPTHSVGGSMAAALMGHGQYMTRLDAYNQLRGHDKPDTSLMAAGRYMERAIAAWFADTQGVHLVEPPRYQPDARKGSTVDRFHWSGDRLIIPGPVPGGLPVAEAAQVALEAWLLLDDREGLECKNANEHVAWKWGPHMEGPIPDEAYIQAQWYLGCTGARAWWVAVCIGGNDFRCYRIEPNAPVIRAIRDNALMFLLDHVDPGVPPAATPEDEGALRIAYPGHTPGVVLEDPPEAIVKAAADLRRWELLVKDASAELQRAKVAVLEFLADAEGLNLPDGSALTYKQNKASVVVDWEAVARDLLARWQLHIRDMSEADAADEFAEAIKNYTSSKPGARVLRKRWAA